MWQAQRKSFSALDFFLLLLLLRFVFLNRYGNGKNKFVSEFYAFERINKWNREEEEKKQQQTKYFISIKYEPNRENLLLNECGWLLGRAYATPTRVT